VKIDESLQGTIGKIDLAAKGKVDLGGLTATDMEDVLADLLPGAEFSFPDLLQAFSKMLGRRQQLMDSLPESIQAALSEAGDFSGAIGGLNENGSNQTGTANSAMLHPEAVSSNRDKEAVTDIAAQLPETTSSEVETQPDSLPRSDAPPASAVGKEPGDAVKTAAGRAPTLNQGMTSLVRDNRSVIDTIRQVTADLEIVERISALQGMNISEPEILQATVDKGLSTLQRFAVNSKSLSSPAVVFAGIVEKALQSGEFGEELSGWTTAITDALDEMTGVPGVPDKLAGWVTRIDPRLATLAQTLNRPELVQVWAVVQEWGTGASASTSGEKLLLDLLNNLVGDAHGSGADPLSPTQGSATSRIGKFELLVSSLGSQPAGLNRLLAALPQVMAEIETMLPERSEGETTEKALDTLSRSAPRWLRTLAENTGRPALLDFWVAAKTADVAPWLKLSRAERQESAVTLKEVASTYEQPEIFRSPVEDSSSRGLMMQVALYAPGHEKPYPALIQIYEEKKDRNHGQQPEQEVWVRVALETDNIGKVDLSFRLQDKKYLSIFSRFADRETASAFKEYLPDIRRELAGSSLELKKMAVSDRTRSGGKGNA
jgi:hypothetical protein